MTDEQLPVTEQQPESGEAEDRLAALERERDEAIDRWKRTAADFDNFRKRTLREKTELIESAGERIVKELLPILDDLERALVAASEHEEAALEEGVRLVHRALGALLERQGLAEIDAN